MGNGKSGLKKKKSYHNFENHPGYMMNDKNDIYFGNKDVSNYDNWKDNMLSDEKSSIKYFTGNAFSKMNEELYNGYEDFNELTGDTKQNAYQLQKVLNKFELKEPILVKRATELEYLGVNHNNVESLEGKTLVFDGFMSSSAANRPAFDGDIWLNVRVPEGKGIGAWVGSISSHPNESEWLFNAGSALKFGKPYKVGSGWDSHWEVDVEYVGKSSKIPTKGKKKK